MRRNGSRLLTAGLLLFVATVLVGSRPARADDCIKPNWTVESVRLHNAPQRSVDDHVELGDVVAVASSSLADLRKCASPNNPLVLYLDGKPLKGMPEYPPSDPAGNEILYTFGVGALNRPVWSALLGSPGIGSTRTVAVSVGLADGYPLPSHATIALRPLPPGWFGLWSALFVAGLIAFAWLARSSNMLRGGTPSGGRTFSIARSQAAWWFFLVLAAYLLIGLTTGDYTTSLNQTALFLLGIASATAVGSAAVDASKNTPAEQAAQQQVKAGLQALANLTPDQQDKLAKLKGESQGWLKDVLSDSEGVDFHRFQMLAWTLVLGIIFVVRVWQTLAMPDFDATLLGLMGLSAGTYVGLKIPETTK